ncbi:MULTISPECIES: phospho-N-acetylmuramoyl-pentapeptide-transferase [unclassified Gordonia (in: high G+C Gram-positive bacteria)]|uniref:phospho-N-acetylmuramoyl-pentapeptide- transferase n=1 Tax=unclassified Gordonia (in: high G+C Gram-positive bacteria) TaxID=2657482 RepID=UPI001FFE2F74|nr:MULTISPECIES: phospho-N-acetylmuramoyl-pentapeptide-transferase [unclassified Gordonia (in: high G+C Gram-positive bacteria)]UQE73586.1 phospho-N-acetylmuramoyl-pentapeptide-transferase [Gordonia sp. PP30]
MTQILIAGAIALAVAILLTPVLIREFSRRAWGQEIRQDGPASHQAKAGTPSMGGLAIILAMWAGYLGSYVYSWAMGDGGPTASGLLVLGLATGLGFVGFLDDFIKLAKHRNLGLNKTQKTIGQLVVAVVFGVLLLQFRNDRGRTPANDHLSYVRDIEAITLTGVGFVIFCWLVVYAWSNAVNFTDGLDGLAAGSTAMVMGTYVLITIWQEQHACDIVDKSDQLATCYNVRDPHDLALVAMVAAAACLGFLWWNAAPAKIFMGDTGSLALGGVVAGLSMTTHTELLMIVIGALFVAEIVSVMIQVASFRTTGKRPFRMAPFHHHFELGGWDQTTVIIRFWLLTAISCALGLGLFYGEWVSG